MVLSANDLCCSYHLLTTGCEETGQTHEGHGSLPSSAKFLSWTSFGSLCSELVITEIATYVSLSVSVIGAKKLPIATSPHPCAKASWIWHKTFLPEGVSQAIRFFTSYIACQGRCRSSTPVAFCLTVSFMSHVRINVVPRHTCDALDFYCDDFECDYVLSHPPMVSCQVADLLKTLMMGFHPNPVRDIDLMGSVCTAYRTIGDLWTKISHPSPNIISDS